MNHKHVTLISLKNETFIEVIMLKPKHFIALIILGGLFFTGFQCSSTEITSAKLYIQQKNYDKALDALKKEVDKNPKSDEGWYLLGVVHGEKEQFDQMIDAFDKSLSISKKFEPNINDSKRYFWATLFNRGVSQFQRATSTQNEDSAKINLDRSAKTFEYAVRLQPDSASTYKNLAFVYINAQQYDKAIPALKNLIERDKSVDGYKFLGEIYYNKGRELMVKYEQSKNAQDSVQALEQFNLAVSTLEEGRRLYPADTEILLVLSNSYIAANKIDVAINAFKAGVEQEPENKYYRYNYGVLLLGANDFEGAAEQFTRAIEIDPNYQNAIYNLAVTYVRWGTAENKEAEEKGENNPGYKKRYEQALPYLEKVVEMDQKNAAIWELLGRVYTVLGMQDDAADAFGRADDLR
jgi:tetratricopeptide (TPR) repeat protein